MQKTAEFTRQQIKPGWSRHIIVGTHLVPDILLDDPDIPPTKIDNLQLLKFRSTSPPL
ncbi:hypothetical protein LOAG_17556 [Loa loa]|uniref:Uncharacterized protein n=1 Tax=Loa loa TaxID=7209 RepID=A0A1S0UHT2_LOALO|nr:hypothetical protein LOAG_17556 [Loa loa]EJD75262.1 hypothetical protein LOAG_17556 [Loa loa]